MSTYTYKRLRKPADCGVWIPATKSFCEEPIHLWRRCEAHYIALKHDDLYETFRAMNLEQRQKSLDVLDDVQKHRPKWEFQGDEATLIAAQEQDDSTAS
jgi:hypothetical protein